MIKQSYVITIKDLREWVSDKEMGENWYIKIYPNNPQKIYAIAPDGNGMAFLDLNEKSFTAGNFSAGKVLRETVLIEDTYKPVF